MFLSKNKKNTMWIPALICSYVKQCSLEAIPLGLLCDRKGHSDAQFDLGLNWLIGSRSCLQIMGSQVQMQPNTQILVMTLIHPAIVADR